MDPVHRHVHVDKRTHGAAIGQYSPSALGMGVLSTSHCRAMVCSSTPSLTNEHTVFFHGQSPDFLVTKVLYVPTIFLLHGDLSLGAVEFGVVSAIAYVCWQHI